MLTSPEYGPPQSRPISVWSGPIGTIIPELPATNANQDPSDYNLPTGGSAPKGNGSSPIFQLWSSGPIRQIEPYDPVDLNDPGTNTTPTDPQAFVTGLYHDFFNREPDPGGLQDWLNYIARGGSLASVVQGFLGSQEYLTTHPNVNSPVPTNPVNPPGPGTLNPNPYQEIPAPEPIYEPYTPTPTNGTTNGTTNGNGATAPTTPGTTPTIPGLGDLTSIFDLLNQVMGHPAVTASGAQDKGGYLVVPTAASEGPSTAPASNSKLLLLLAVAGIVITIAVHFWDKRRKAAA
jgi:hypothetical protein